MRNLVCVFLVFLLNRSVLGVPTALSADCYRTDINICLGINRTSVPPDKEYDEVVFQCFKKLQEELVECNYPKFICVRVNMKFTDDDTLILNECIPIEAVLKKINGNDPTDLIACKMFTDWAERMGHKKLAGRADCFYCLEDYCNSRSRAIKKKGSLLQKNATASSKNKNKSTVTLSNFAMLLFVPLVSLIF